MAEVLLRSQSSPPGVTPGIRVSAASASTTERGLFSRMNLGAGKKKNASSEIPFSTIYHQSFSLHFLGSPIFLVLSLFTFPFEKLILITSTAYRG